MKGEFSKKLIPIGKASEYLGVSIDTVRRWDEKGLLNSTRPDGKNRYFSIEELEKIKFSQPLTISEAAQRLDISEATLRRLEKKDIIKPDYDKNGNRIYTIKCLENFIKSDYYLRKKEIEENILTAPETKETTSDDYQEDVKSLREQHRIITAELEDHRQNIQKLNFFKKIFKDVLLTSIACFILTVIILTFFFLRFPEEMKNWPGFNSSNFLTAGASTGNGIYIRAVYGSDDRPNTVLSSFLAPAEAIALEVVNVLAPETYGKILPIEPVEEPIDILKELTKKYDASNPQGYLRAKDLLYYATSGEVSTIVAKKEDVVQKGKQNEYWRGDKTWQPLDKAAIGLSNVENTALSTWFGSENITTVGRLTGLKIGNYNGLLLASDGEVGTAIAGVDYYNNNNQINHDALNNFDILKHFKQSDITHISSLLNTGLIKTTNGTGELSIIADNSANWDLGFTYRLVSAISQGPLHASLANNVLNLSIDQANSTSDGYISAGDWNAFNNKVSSQWTTSGTSIYYNYGNVGIGTDSPSGKLHVLDNSTSTALTVNQQSTGDILNLQDNGSSVLVVKDGGNVAVGGGTVPYKFHVRVSPTNNVATAMYLKGHSAVNGDVVRLGFGVTGADTGYNHASIDVERNAPSSMIFNTINASGSFTESMRIQGSNVGIGTDSPSAKLDIYQGNLDLDNTTNANQYGIITRDGVRFIHNFNYGDNGTVTTVGYNTFVGEEAGNLTMGSTATQVYHASYNTAVGRRALYSNTTGYQNAALGYASLYFNTTGSYNAALGHASLYNNTTGYYNTALGSYSLYFNTTGSYNTALGYASLYSNTTGYRNTALGYYAGRYIADGSTANETSNTSVYLGHDTRALADGDANEIVIGYNAIGNGSNSVTLGNSSIIKTVLRGETSITANLASTALTVNQQSTGDILNLQDNGSSVFVVKDGGNVGIGTSSPGAKLEVSGSILINSGSNVSYFGTTNKVGIQGDRTAWGELSAGCLIASYYSSSLNIGPSYSGKAGNKLILPYFNQSTWYSALEFANVSSGYSNLLLMKSGGNVGIGTDSPSGKLHIKSDGNTWETYSLRINNSDNTSIFTIQDHAVGKFNGQMQILGNIPNSLYVPNSGAYISGNVGIGTDSPSANDKLTVFQSAIVNSGTVKAMNFALSAKASVASSASYRANYGQVTPGNNYAYTGDFVGSWNDIIQNRAYNLSTAYGYVSNVKANNSGTITSGHGYWTKVSVDSASSSIGNFYNFTAKSPAITNSGTITTASYGIYIEQQGVTGVGSGYGVYQIDSGDTNYFAGNVGIGTTSPDTALQVNGTIAPEANDQALGTTALRWNTYGTSADFSGTVTIGSLGTAGGTALCLNGGVVSYCSSSQRYKENISNISFGLEDVMKLRPVEFTWKKDGSSSFGLIAEEAYAVNPLFSFKNDKGKIEGVNYSNLTALLVKAIQEQQSVIVSIKNRIANVEKKIVALDLLSELVATKRLSVEDEAEFMGDVRIAKHLIVGEDTAGTVEITSGSDEAIVNFENNFQTPPIVNITPMTLVDCSYYVDSVTNQGFTIKLERTFDRSIQFNWLALGK